MGIRGSPPQRARPLPGADFGRLTQGRGPTRPWEAGAIHRNASSGIPDGPAQQDHANLGETAPGGVKGLPAGQTAARRTGTLQDSFVGRPFPLTPSGAGSIRAATWAENGAAGGAAPAALPCLNSHNSIHERALGALGEGLNALTGSHRRTAAALGWNVQALAETFGLERLGFLTLTFRDHVLDAREARRRFNSLASNVLRTRYPAGHLCVVERQKSGRVHFHLLVVLPIDIRTGVDFEAVARGEYSSASAALRAEWAYWRRTAPLYGFGRTELLPVRSTAEGIGKYVGKYVAKHIGQRIAEDKGVRLVSYSKGARAATTRFAWASPGAAEWRRKVASFVGASFELGLIAEPSFRGMRDTYGARWCYHFREHIRGWP